MRNEKWFKTYLVKKLEAKGIIVDQTHTTMKMGMPDLILCIEGRCVWLELKFLRKLPGEPGDEHRLGHPLTARQSKWLRDWAAHGALSHAVIGFDDGSLVYIDEFKPGPLKKFTVDRIFSADEYIDEVLCSICVQRLSPTAPTPQTGSRT